MLSIQADIVQNSTVSSWNQCRTKSKQQQKTNKQPTKNKQTNNNKSHKHTQTNSLKTTAQGTLDRLQQLRQKKKKSTETEEVGMGDEEGEKDPIWNVSTYTFERQTIIRP